jgi:deoxyribodipyrimidine photo-lyase
VQTAVAVFTRDLRLRDNPVLAAAHADGERIIPLFVFDDFVLSTAHGRPNRFGFLCESLRDLDASVRARGGALIVRRGRWVDEVVRITREFDVSSVHVARDVSAYGRERNLRLKKAAACPVFEHDGITVVPPDAFDKPFAVFTHYWRRWFDAPWRDDAPVPRRLAVAAGIDLGSIPTARPPKEWQGGERAGLARVAAWSRRTLARYDEQRDLPGVDATSRLSPYLHFGCLSASDVARRLWERDGSDAFVRQLCWRDFFAQLLWWRPEVAHADVRPGRAPRWRDAPGDLEAWKAGRTGFVTASFLTRDLRIDWREGAAHFMDLLVDGDLANNQLNWQWVAGTGTDTNPFRVLNPTAQSRRHDPDGVYVRRWVDELSALPGDVDVHDPPFDVRRKCRYAEPIIDHAEAIETWRASLGA